MIATSHYVILSLVLFTLGIVGLMVRRNFITVLMCVELILNAANINFIAYSRQLGDLTGQVFAVCRVIDETAQVHAAACAQVFQHVVRTYLVALVGRIRNSVHQVK